MKLLELNWFSAGLLLNDVNYFLCKWGLVNYPSKYWLNLWRNFNITIGMFITFLLKYQMHSSLRISGRKPEVNRIFYLILRQLRSVNWEPSSSSSSSSKMILTWWLYMRPVMKCSGPAMAISSWVRGSASQLTRAMPAVSRASTILSSALPGLGLTTNTSLGSPCSKDSTDWTDWTDRSSLASFLPVRGRHRHTESRRRRRRRTERTSRE